MKHPSLASYIILGIIFVLIAVAIRVPPIYAVDPPQPRETLVHVKQCATALAIYRADFDDRLPIADQWMSATLPYSKDPLIYIDPRNPAAHPPTDPKLPQTGLYGIAFFTPMSQVEVGKIKEPDQQIVLFTSTHLRWNAAAELNSVNPTASRSMRQFTAAFADSSARRFFVGYPGLNLKTGVWK